MLGFEIFFVSIAGLLTLGGLVRAIRILFFSTKKSPVWTAADIPVAMAQAAAEGWIHRALCAFDIAVNVILLRGQQDETISAHSWRAAVEGKRWGRVMCWWLDLFQANHGPQAACGDLQRAQNRVAVLKKFLGLV